MCLSLQQVKAWVVFFGRAKVTKGEDVLFEGVFYSYHFQISDVLEYEDFG